MCLATLKEQVRKLVENDSRRQRQLAEIRDSQIQFEVQRRTLTESQQAALTRQRRARFADEVGGRSAGAVRWNGDHAQHVEQLEKLAVEFGEQSEQVRKYIEDQRHFATTGEHPDPYPVLRLRYSDEPAGNSPTDLLDFAAKKLMRENQGRMTYTEALGLAARQNPDLYEQHVAAV